MLKYLFFYVLILLTSCSTSKLSDSNKPSKEKIIKRNEELMKDFSVEKKVLEKFKIKKVKSKKSKKRMVDIPLPDKKSPINYIKKNSYKKKLKKVSKSFKLETKSFSKYPADFPNRLMAFDDVSKKFWSSFTPYIFEGEETILKIKYLGVNTGSITISSHKGTKLGDQPVFHLNARLKTASFYSYLYELDDYCDSYVTKKEFKPLKFSLIQRQSAQDIDDLQLFDHEEFKTYTFYKRVTDKKSKKSKSERLIPYYFQDPLSIVYFVRGLPMIVGNYYEIPIVNKGKVETLSAKIIGREILKTDLGKRKAVKIEISTKHKGKTLKGGEMTFWYSDDDKRIFLKFEADIKIGSVSGRIESYKVNK